MTANGVLKSLKPEGWPDRINVGRAVVRFPNGTESGGWYSRPQGDDETAEYIRRDPAVLAALPEVRAMIDEALREGMRIATFVPIEQVPGAFAEAAAAIRAKGGEA